MESAVSSPPTSNEVFDNDKVPSVETPQNNDLSDSTVEVAQQNHRAWDATKLAWARKLHIVIAGFTCTFNCNLGSSMPSGALDAIAEQFSVTNRLHLTLLNSLYMVGYVLGPLVFGPLSEYIGRRPVLISTYLGYFIFMLACSGAPSYAALLVFRLLCGVNAAAPTTVINGLYADILDDPSQRGLALAVYMTVTTIGPSIGPLVSGFSSQSSWRWPFWAAALIAAPGLPIVLTIPETFAPVLHNKIVKKQMADGQNTDGESLEKIQPFDARKIFLRPFTLLFTEPILLSTSLYLTLAYSIMYLLFQTYPIVFQKFYGLTPSIAGLMYLPMIVGVILSLVVFYLYTTWRDRSVRAGKEWTRREVYRRLPLACVASPCMVIALFWLGWTTQESISPIVPALNGVFFFLGFQLVFLGMSNYLTDVYRQYAASAHAAASTTRSIGAIVLPLATDSMFRDLGIHWAPSLLGFLCLGMGVIPFVFIRYGDALARRSKSARALYGISDSS